jgi:predicted component of type VI protein secretion system
LKSFSQCLTMSQETNHQEVKLLEIKEQVKNMIYLHEDLKAEKQQLEDKNKLLEEMVEEQQKLIHDLQEQNKILKLAKMISGGNDQNSRDIKLRINQMIREIDKSIALLNT